MGTPTVAHPGTAVAVTGPLNWADELRGAGALLKSGLVPREIKTPEAALFIILTGRDLGMSPVQSLRSIRVIQGKVEVAADAQLGRFHSSGGRSRWVELTDKLARLELTAPWSTSPHTETFSIEDAQRAGLASGDNWRKYPKAMLRSRAITAGLKSIGFDATAGMYGYGEISGAESVAGEVVGAAEPEATSETAAEVVVTEDGEIVPTLPGKSTSWGGHGGKPMTDVPTSALAAFVKWCIGDEDKSAKYDDEIRFASAEVARREALEPSESDVQEAFA